MSALSRFLGKDAAARAVLIAALALPIAAQAAHAAPPDRARGNLVALDGAADGLSKVMTSLKDGTRRCLVAQGRMLAEVRTVPRDPEAARAGALRAADARSDSLQAEMGDSLDVVAAGAMLGLADLDPAQRQALAHHRNLRSACLQWTVRSLDGLFDALGEEKGPDLAGKVAEMRRIATRDGARLSGLARGEGLLDEAALQGMESYRAGR